MTHQPLDLILEFSEGTGELTADLTHPAIAAFRRGMEEGQLTGTWRYLIVHDQPHLRHTIIGTFVKTPKGRVLFFPGARVAIETDDPTARFNGKRLDHITADSPKAAKASSHVAVQGLPRDQSRGLDQRSVPPHEYMWPWFSLLAPDLSGFTQLPARLVVHFPPPPGELVEFGNRLLAEGGLKVVPLPSVSGPGISYLQFDAWLGRGPDWQALQVRPLAWPYKPEIVQGAPDEEQQLQVRRVDISLDSQIGIVVLVSRPLGTLLGARILRPTLSQ